ncbi:MAG TPA: hypothetical protein VHZ74_26915 [Bryobacteraceae bacterium]|nr:hypothetical protein [Bryobacteraceae bacterium]
MWKYAFPPDAPRPDADLEDLHVHLTVDGTQWTGLFACTRGRHVEILPWPAAHAIIVAASNAVYIVDPQAPEEFSGIAAPVEISGVIFDESGQHMFVAGSLRVYAFSADRHFVWISESLEGYGARFCGCGGRVLAVQVNPFDPRSEGEEEAAPAVVRLRTEDGTILRSRFRLAHRYWMRSEAA